MSLHMKTNENNKSTTTKVISISAILQIIKDIAYIVSRIFKKKEQDEKLKLLKELEGLKVEIKKAIDSGNEAKLSELLKKRKEIEDKIRIINDKNHR